MTSAGIHTLPVVLIFAFLALLLPLLSFVLSLATRERYAWLVGPGATFLLLAATVCAFNVVSTVWSDGPLLSGAYWFTMGGAPVSADVLLTKTSSLMLLVVSVISFLVHLYSSGYMAGDGGIRKYFAMLGFFTFSMQGIVLADSLLIMFVFWELVGFSSYMLIGHWMSRPAAASAAKKAFIFNRVGDLGFLIGLMIIWTNTASFSLTHLLEHTPSAWHTAASLCIFCGIVGKSAQFPLFPWLPDAMEGPTPVSALIHAATMVAAGVYLLIRIFPLFTPDSLFVVAWTGMITAVTGAVAALYQFDLKKILAYSTISQLGLMIMALGIGIVDAALLHLFTHAFFKACLFLSAGSVIHVIHVAQHRSHQRFDAQDIRNLGGLRAKLPATFLAFSLGAASLAGLPFFSGFLSKEAILASIWMNTGIVSWIMLVAMFGVSFMTVLYTFRMLWFVFMGEARHSVSPYIRRPPMIMRAPAILLAVGSLWFVVSWNPFDFAGWLWSGRHEYTHLVGVTVFSGIWIAVALLVSYRLFKKARFDRNRMLENAFYVDTLYERTFGRMATTGAMAVSHIDKKWLDGIVHGIAYAQVALAHVTSWFDSAIVDGVVNGVARLSAFTGGVTRSFQGGKIQLYIFWSVLAIIIFLIWILE